MEERKCELCSSVMKEHSRIKISDTDYIIFRCTKCGHEIAVSSDSL